MASVLMVQMAAAYVAQAAVVNVAQAHLSRPPTLKVQSLLITIKFFGPYKLAGFIFQ